MASNSTPHLLVVEDHPVFRRFLTAWLSRQYNVTAVSSGIDALRWLQGGHQADALLLDLDMPGISGWQVAHNLRASGLFCEIPVVGLTKEVNATVRERCDQLCIDDVFSRPFKPEAVLEALSYATSPASLQQAA